MKKFLTIIFCTVIVSATLPGQNKPQSAPPENFFPFGVLTACNSTTVPSITNDPSKTKEYFENMCRDISGHGMNTIINFSSPTDAVKTLLEVADVHNLKVLPSINEFINLNIRTLSATNCQVKWDVFKTPEKPAIDGRLQDNCWKLADRSGPFINLFASGYPSEPTTAQILHDDENIYIACDLKAASLKTNCDKQGDDVYQDDCLEVFITSPNNPEIYYHFITNAKGTQFDEIREKGTSAVVSRGKLKWQAAGLRTDTGCTIEIAIPFKSMGVSAIKPTDEWHMNITRINHSKNELSSWAVTNSFHRQERFGRIQITNTEKNKDNNINISGRLMDEKGSPVTGLPMTCEQFTAISGPGGEFSFEGISRGRHTLDFYESFAPAEFIVQEHDTPATVTCKRQIPANKSPEKIRETAEKITKLLKGNKSLIGYFTCDEPHGIGWSIDQLALINKTIKEIDPDHPAFNCLDKPEYVASFCAKVNPKIVLHDNYPLKFAPSDNFKNFTKEIDLVRSSTPEKTPLWIIVQAHGFDSKAEYLREPTPQELRAMTFLAIAHGAKGIIYFLYQTLGDAGGMFGMLDKNGKSTAKWDEIQKIAPKIKAMAPTLLQLSYQEKGCSATGNTDVQLFKDDAGKQYIIAVNKDVSKDADIEIKIPIAANNPSEETRALDVYTRQEYILEKEGGSLKFKSKLAAGDGALFSLR